MKSKNTLSIAVPLLSVLLLLTLSLTYTSAVPSSPYLMILPEETLDSTLTPGSTYTISIVTDYDGIDIWSWSFELFFNPAVLEVLEVHNGDLITTDKHPDALFVQGFFDNPNGMLETTHAWIDYEYPPAPTTYGPGTLAYVDFNVTGYGTSDIEFSASAQQSSKLIDGFNEPIIDAHRDSEWNQIGNGYFDNRLGGDANGDRSVNWDDFIILASGYGSSVGDPSYDVRADFNHDGIINWDDFIILAGNYGISI